MDAILIPDPDPHELADPLVSWLQVASPLSPSQLLAHSRMQVPQPSAALERLFISQPAGLAGTWQGAAHFVAVDRTVRITGK